MKVLGFRLRKQLPIAIEGDFSMAKRELPPVHPGEILLEDFLKPMEITRYRLAKSIGVPQRRIDEICAGNRAIMADTALRLARFFGTDAQSWMNLQAGYDLETAEITLVERIEREVTPLESGCMIRTKPCDKSLLFSRW